MKDGFVDPGNALWVFYEYECVKRVMVAAKTSSPAVSMVLNIDGCVEWILLVNSLWYVRSNWPTLCCVPQERSVVRNQIIWTLTTHEREGDLISQLLLRIEQRTVDGLRPGVREGGRETEKDPNISAWMSFATRGGGGAIPENPFESRTRRLKRQLYPWTAQKDFQLSGGINSSPLPPFPQLSAFSPKLTYWQILLSV